MLVSVFAAGCFELSCFDRSSLQKRDWICANRLAPGDKNLDYLQAPKAAQPDSSIKELTCRFAGQSNG